MRQSWKCKHTNWILDDFEKLLFTFFFFRCDNGLWLFSGVVIVRVEQECIYG